MQIEIIKVPKQKSWGISPNRDKYGHIHTGYVGYMSTCAEEVGTNAIITGDFHIDGMSRGRSAANFNGHFRGHEEAGYQLGMSGTVDLLLLLQADDHFHIVDGYIRGTWTFAKQGESIFLKPHVGA